RGPAARRRACARGSRSAPAPGAAAPAGPGSPGQGRAPSRPAGGRTEAATPADRTSPAWLATPTLPRCYFIPAIQSRSRYRRDRDGTPDATSSPSWVAGRLCEKRAGGASAILECVRFSGALPVAFVVLLTRTEKETKRR